MHLKPILVLLLLCLISSVLPAQNKTYQIKADSVRIFSDCDTAELILQNRTRNVLNGALFNKGNGVTEFRKILTRINSCTYLIGADSLKLDACNGAGSGSMAWLLNGNNLGGIYKTFGTTDNVDLPIITNNTEKMRVMANGNIGIGTSTPAAKLHVTNALGTILINPNLSRPADVIRVGGYINTTDGQNVLLSASSDGGNNFRNLVVERDGFLGLGNSNANWSWWVGNPALRFDADGRIAIASNYFHFGNTGGPYNASSLITYVSDVDEWVSGPEKVKGQNYYYFGTVLQTATAGNKRSPLKISGNELLFLTGDMPTNDNFYGRGKEAMRISQLGNILAGTTTDNGSKLQLNGSFYHEGNAVQQNGSYAFGNAILFDSYDLFPASRIFAGGPIVYQSNNGGNQHYFLNQIGAGFTGNLVTIDPGSPYTLNPNQLALNVFGMQGKNGLSVNMLGYTGLGTTSPTATLHALGTVRFQNLPNGNGDPLVIDASGNITRGGGTPSDFNLKENIVASQFDAHKLLGLIIKDFNYKADKNKTRYTGLIAQELKTVIPELVLGAEGSYSIDYVKMVPYLLKAIQHQQKEIDELKQPSAAINNNSVADMLELVKQLQQQVTQQQKEMTLLKEKLKNK